MPFSLDLDDSTKARLLTLNVLEHLDPDTYGVDPSITAERVADLISIFISSLDSLVNFALRRRDGPVIRRAVGQLPDEPIYELQDVPSSNSPSTRVEHVKKWLEEKLGVRAVEVMVPRTKSHRRFEC